MTAVCSVLAGQWDGSNVVAGFIDSSINRITTVPVRVQMYGKWARLMRRKPLTLKSGKCTVKTVYEVLTDKVGMVRSIGNIVNTQYICMACDNRDSSIYM